MRVLWKDPGLSGTFYTHTYTYIAKRRVIVKAMGLSTDIYIFCYFPHRLGGFTKHSEKCHLQQEVGSQFSQFFKIYIICLDLQWKLIFASPKPRGCRWGQFNEDVFVRNCMKCPDMYRKLIFAKSPLHIEGMGVKTNWLETVLLEIKWNVWICTENQFFSNPSFIMNNKVSVYSSF